ncbi:ABC transporter ATP-binding protein [Anaerosporobacter faecicola]|uniref:ABC transporter ATP-binding protein n=1 Tax=Anaerosporobacter faecicola TaxID=2718714 RepID=UPI001439E1BE|nr:ABC transporter ATP-binding protein [Anaerosporobacter faecicola]
MKNAIELNQLQKKFGDKVAVKGSTFQVEEGILFSLLGVNGAGKTTTIRMLTGLSKPTSGEAYVGGYNIKTELDQVKKICNVSTQETAIAPNLTVEENLLFVAQIYGFSTTEAKKRMEEVMKQFSLDEVRKSKAKTLSGGWQRRLSIGMALITNPKILFLDEPTLGLDVLARKQLWKIISGLKGKITIVLTTHYMEEAEALSDKVAIMVDGELKACNTVDEIKAMTQKDSLEDAFIAIAEGEV